MVLDILALVGGSMLTVATSLTLTPTTFPPTPFRPRPEPQMRQCGCEWDAKTSVHCAGYIRVCYGVEQQRGRAEPGLLKHPLMNKGPIKHEQ